MSEADLAFFLAPGPVSGRSNPAIRRLRDRAQQTSNPDMNEPVKSVIQHRIYIYYHNIRLY